MEEVWFYTFPHRSYLLSTAGGETLEQRTQNRTQPYSSSSRDGLIGSTSVSKTFIIRENDSVMQQKNACLHIVVFRNVN